MDDVYIAGTGMTRFGKIPGRAVRSMAEEATAQALENADIDRETLQAILFLTHSGVCLPISIQSGGR